LKTICSDLTLV